MFDKLAEELKAARIKNNLTLKQLSGRTRIDIKFLEAIEEGNFSFLPEIYVKAFIKEYASVVGLNGDIILKKYEAAKEGLPIEDVVEDKYEGKTEQPAAETTGKKEPLIEKPEKVQEDKQPVNKVEVSNSQPMPVYDSTTHSQSKFQSGNKNIYLIGGVIGGVLILFGLIYLIFFKSSSEIIVAEKPYDEVVAESQKRYEEKPSAVKDSSANDTTQNNYALSDSLNLLIQTTDTSWIKILIDNSKAEEFILFPNSQKSLKAGKDFKITFGRSSAIKLHLNGKPLAFNPKSKNVSNVLINSYGIEILEKTSPKGNE